jgi:hypothetical protein
MQTGFQIPIIGMAATGARFARDQVNKVVVHRKTATLEKRRNKKTREAHEVRVNIEGPNPQKPKAARVPSQARNDLVVPEVDEHSLHQPVYITQRMDSDPKTHTHLNGSVYYASPARQSQRSLSRKSSIVEVENVVLRARPSLVKLEFASTSTAGLTACLFLE